MSLVDEAGDAGIQVPELYDLVRGPVKRDSGADYYWTTFEADLYWLSRGARQGLYG